MKIRPLVALLGSITLGVRKYLDFKVRMAKLKVGLHWSKKTIGGCFKIMVKGAILLNFSRDDETLFEIAPKKCKLVKAFGMIKSCPFKSSRPKP
jgi:hypothetical protein